MPGLGHNNGPTMEPGESWRRHAWGKARAQLMPVLPIEVVRLRVKRAAEIGLDYKTYASIRAASGHDVIAFMFSTNALRLLAPQPSLPLDRQEKLAAIIDTGRVALTRAPLTPEHVLDLASGLIDHAASAPRPFAPWGESRKALLAAISAQKWPADRVVMVGDTSDERVWAQSARLGYYLPADRYFAA
ncbi:hypothetical protein [Pararhodobacter zhoushanensis]|uniref:Haloacid dehalogenase-like hydrolase n=1 Tax=Pararhodobacter zhoushanensis TaxID=2479545 RepID=A0ABT3GX23_9RHOB|nr:hypothetical protein [Pararhodobacter zhoushanensis]MCW1932072.1 hypothetical protein [Pararhodobacter zhoushanensis]